MISPVLHERNLRFREVGDPPEATQLPELVQTPRHGTWSNIYVCDKPAPEPEAAPLEKAPSMHDQGAAGPSEWAALENA